MFSDKDIDDAFSRIDADGNGRLSRLELQEVFRSFAVKRSLSDEELALMVDAFVARWDADESGDLCKDEFKRLALSIGEQVHPVIYQLSACVFLMCVPFGIIVPYEPQLVASLGITAAQFGAAQGAMFMAKFVCNIPITDVVDRLGSKPVLVGSTCLLGLSLGGLSLTTSVEHLAICRAIGGVAIAGLSASIQAPAIAVSTTLNRARSSAPFTQAMNAGIALGPAIGGVLAGVVSMETAFAGVGASFLLTAAASYKIYSETAPPTGSKHAGPLSLFTTAFSAWRRVLQSSREVRALYCASGAVMSAVGGANMTILPLFLAAEPLSLTASSIGLLSAGIATVGIIVTQPLAVFADRYGRRTAVGLGSAVMGTSMLLVPLAGTPAMVAGALASTAIGQNLLSPAISGQLIDAVSRRDPQIVTQAMSLLRSVQDVGMVSGATLIGLVGSHIGYAAGFEVSGAAVIAMGLATASRLPRAAGGRSAG